LGWSPTRIDQAAQSDDSRRRLPVSAPCSRRPKTADLVNLMDQSAGLPRQRPIPVCW